MVDLENNINKSYIALHQLNTVLGKKKDTNKNYDPEKRTR